MISIDQIDINLRFSKKKNQQEIWNNRSENVNLIMEIDLRCDWD